MRVTVQCDDVHCQCTLQSTRLVYCTLSTLITGVIMYVPFPVLFTD